MAQAPCTPFHAFLAALGLPRTDETTTIIEADGLNGPVVLDFIESYGTYGLILTLMPKHGAPCSIFVEMDENDDGLTLYCHHDHGGFGGTPFDGWAELAQAIEQETAPAWQRYRWAASLFALAGRRPSTPKRSRAA